MTSSASYISSIKDLEEYTKKFDRSKNFLITSNIPDICKNEPCKLGIDEAGRGPVLGPMVYGTCFCPKLKEDQLKESGCDDSKSLTEDKRETIFNKMCVEQYLGWEVEVISPTFISNCMLQRQKYSLNEISQSAAVNLIKRAIEAGVNVTEVFVDTVGPPEKYEAKLKNIFPELDITVAKKADAEFAVVGAASIFAKVTRDICLRTWTFVEFPNLSTADLSCGSGYPNDPDTKKFIANNIDPIFGYPQIVRFSWSTASNALDEKAITVEWEKEELPTKTRSVKSFFAAPSDNKLIVKHRYFKDRNLTSVTDF